MKKILGAVLALGAVYRLAFLGQRQLWTDELIQASVIRASSPHDLIKWLKAGVSLPAPLDYFIQKGFVVLLGESPWSLRLHAAILGSLSVWLFYRIASRMFGLRPALYATALFAIYPLHQHYSQEGRPFALLVFLTLASYDVLLRTAAVRTRRLGWVVLLAITILLLYSNILAIPVILAQAAGLVFVASFIRNAAEPSRPGSRNIGATDLVIYAIVAALAFVVYAPWVLYSWSKPLVVSRSDLVNPKILLVALKGLGDGSFPVAGLLLAGAVVGIRALRRHGNRSCLIWLLTWVVVYVAAVWVFDVWTGYFFAARQLVAASPALIMLAGYGMAHIGERLTILDELPYRISSPAQVYALMLLVMSVWVAQRHWRYDPADWRGTAQLLREDLKEGDALSAPMVHSLLEYLVPSLENFRSADMDPGPGTIAGGGANKRLVVCYNGMSPDPCRSFRDPASRDKSWTRFETRGFTIFERSTP